MHVPGESLDQILIQLSSRFASVDGGQIRSEIDHGLQTVARFLQAKSYGLLEPLGDVDSTWVLTFRTPQGTSPSDAWSERFLFELLEAHSGDVILRLGTREPQPRSWQERSLLPRSGSEDSIAVPICLGARILGVVAFDSPASPTMASSEHLHELHSIAAVLAHGLQRKRAEEQLEDSLEFEHVLMNLTAALSRAPPTNVESALEEAARHLAEALRLDQVSLLEVASGAESPRTICAYTGCSASGTLPSGRHLKEINDRLLVGDLVRVADGRMLEPEESAPVDAPTLLFVPLAISGTTLCVVIPATRFGAPRRSELLPSRLELAGEILASAWARTRDQGKSPILDSSAPSWRAAQVYARELFAPEHAIEGVIGQSDVLRYVLFKVDQVARTDATTLLL